jgi:uncharacterized repeat protein (TIGR03803 family)
VAYRVLYSFTGGTDGAGPLSRGGLVRDASGNLYGTTYQGGDLSCGGGYGCGVIFKVDPHGNETVLHSFTYSEGIYPIGGLVRDRAGNLYGTTSIYGPGNNGTVFKLDTSGNLTVLYAFTGGSDGGFPEPTLTRDAAGNLYGTTASGGSGLNGVVFVVNEQGQETVLHTFDGTDGSDPTEPLLRDANGNLYGTTSAGGSSNAGTVFKLDKMGNETVLYSFKGVPDGYGPNSDLFRDAAGNWYGATYQGGTYNWGALFRLNSRGKETVLYSFTRGPDGSGPDGLLRDRAGNLYGTTSVGGSPFCGSGFACGVVFKFDNKGKLLILHTFDGSDGAGPGGGLVTDGKGNFYGTAYYGGIYGRFNGTGVVFEISVNQDGESRREP